jgi:Secretion system C-terminal sorting domain
MSLDGNHKRGDSIAGEFPLPVGNYGVEIYPNPAPGGSIFNVSVRGEAGGHVSIKLFDILGRVVTTVYEGPMRNETKTFEISRVNLPPGMYAVSVSTPSRSYGKSFIVQ